MTYTWGDPPPIQKCHNPNHPAKRHGHYGFGGIHWCSDWGSPLLSEENMGHVQNGYIVIFEKADPDA